MARARGQMPPMMRSAHQAGLLQCRVCGCVSRPPAQPLGRFAVMHCPRCDAKLLPPNKANSVEITWALLLAAALLYIPANTLPVMSVYLLGAGQADTLISGVYHLLEAGQWPLALIVFVASIVVPLLKLLTLSFLLISIQRRSRWRQHDRMRLYRITEYVGRWSMVDVFVIAILTGLVQFGNLARVDANLGSLSFAAVVVLTMIAARTLDEHLIWDEC
ncbi:MAG: paraquat-inducible protein A [Thiothrix sp.]